MSNGKGNSGNNINWQWHSAPLPGAQPSGQPPQQTGQQQNTQAPQLVRPVPVRPGQNVHALLSQGPQPPSQPVPSQLFQPIPQPQQQPAPTVTTTTNAQGPAPQGVRAQSPGGTSYQRNDPPGHLRRRDAAGYKNPGHKDNSMVPVWRDAAVSPNPFAPGQPQEDFAQEKAHLHAPNRRFRTKTPNGTDTGIIQGHGQGILGHKPDAATHFNSVGHTQTRQQNQARNNQPSTYHGIETPGRSSASGSGAERYMSPGPTTGSHPSHWKTTDPGFRPDVPWHTWTPVTTQNNNNTAPPQTVQPSPGTGSMAPVQPPLRPQTTGSTTLVRPPAQLSQMGAPPSQNQQQQLNSQPVLAPFMGAPSPVQPQLSPMAPSGGPQGPQHPMSLPPLAPYPMLPPPQQQPGPTNQQFLPSVQALLQQAPHPSHPILPPIQLPPPQQQGNQPGPQSGSRFSTRYHPYNG